MLTYWNLKEFPNNIKVSTLKVLQQLNSIVLLSETLTASPENLQEDLLELQDKKLASTIREQKQRALEFWERNWVFISFCYYPPLFPFYSFSISISSPVFESHTKSGSSYQHSAVPLKIRRLAQEPEKFMWALSIAQTRCMNKQIRIGALVQDSNMLIPYAGQHLNSL